MTSFSASSRNAGAKVELETGCRGFWVKSDVQSEEVGSFTADDHAFCSVKSFARSLDALIGNEFFKCAAGKRLNLMLPCWLNHCKKTPFFARDSIRHNFAAATSVYSATFCMCFTISYLFALPDFPFRLAKRGGYVVRTKTAPWLLRRWPQNKGGSSEDV
jgi:hypothetical protein